MSSVLYRHEEGRRERAQRLHEGRERSHDWKQKEGKEMVSWLFFEAGGSTREAPSAGVTSRSKAIDQTKLARIGSLKLSNVAAHYTLAIPNPISFHRSPVRFGSQHRPQTIRRSMLLIRKQVPLFPRKRIREVPAKKESCC